VPNLFARPDAPVDATPIAPAASVGGADAGATAQGPLSRASSERQPRKFSRGAEAGRRSDELSRMVLLFALLFLAAAVLIIGRTARDALFLTRFPVTWIAPMWLAYAGVSSVVALGYARFVTRLPRARFITLFTAGAALTYAVLRVLIGLEIRAAYVVFYVWSDVIANLTAVAVWTLANDLYDARSAKRVFGVLGIGQVLGTVVCGFFTARVVSVLGTENLLIVLVGVLLTIGALASLLARSPSTTSAHRAEPEAGSRHDEPVLRSRYVATMAAMTLLLFVALTVGDYQFKAIVRASYPARDELAGFMADFYGGLGLVSLFVQLAVAPRLLRRFGVLAGLVAMPAAFMLSSLGLLAWPTLTGATIVKGSDNGLQYTVYDSTVQLLYFPFSEKRRDRVRTFISAVVKPFGCGVGAIALMLLVPDTGRDDAATIHAAATLGYFTVPVGLAVVGLAVMVRRGYVEAMRRTLIRRGTAAVELDASPSTLAILDEALRSPDSPQVLFAADRLRELAPERLQRVLGELASHRSARVRAMAMHLAYDLYDPRGPELARLGLIDEDATVRVAAVETLGAMEHEDAHDELIRLADLHEDDLVRSAAIAALLRYCGLDGMLDGAPRLHALLESAVPKDRVAAARVLGSTGDPTLQRALARLLSDPELSVRRAAIQAASAVRSKRLLPSFLGALETRALASAAARAIVTIGDAAVPELAATLSDPTVRHDVRLMVPRILFRIETSSALDALLARLDEPDVRLRQKILASASRLRQALQAPRAAFSVVRARIDREIEAHIDERDAYVRVRAALRHPLLDEALFRRLRGGLIRILRLCELAYSRETVAAVRAHVFGGDPRLRANAFEVFETLLDPAYRDRLVALFEAFLALEGGAAAAGPRPSSAELVAWIEGEVVSGEAYRAALVLDAVASRGLVVAGPLALSALEHADPLVREAAAMAVARARPIGAAEALARLQADPDDVVRARAEYSVKTLARRSSPEDSMYSTVEKVLLLQRIAVFSRVAGDELITLARNSPVVAMHHGEVVFRQGDRGSALYLILSGDVKLTVDEREVARLGPNEVFGEMSIFDREPRAATATVVSEAELLRVSAVDFHDAVRETAEVAEAVIQVLNKRLRESNRRLAEARAELARATRTPIVPKEPFGVPRIDPSELVAISEDDD
jgi:CRP-like cAMP-binding protein/ATP/ADP translocase